MLTLAWRFIEIARDRTYFRNSYKRATQKWSLWSTNSWPRCPYRLERRTPAGQWDIVSLQSSTWCNCCIADYKLRHITKIGTMRPSTGPSNNGGIVEQVFEDWQICAWISYMLKTRYNHPKTSVIDLGLWVLTLFKSSFKSSKNIHLTKLYCI